MATIPHPNAVWSIHIPSGQYPSDIQHIADVPLSMKLKLRLTMLMVAGCFLSGCGPTRPVTRDVLVGGYTYVSNAPENRPRDHEWDHLTLQADGKYDLVQGGPTKVKSEMTGTWTFTAGDSPQVMLDHAGYPVRVKSGEVRLMIDFDTGVWYAKTN